MRYRRRIFLFLVVLSLSLLPSCTQPASTKSNAHDKESFDKIELIDDTNRNLIGKEGSGGDVLVVSADEIDQMLGSEGPTPEEIPENPIVTDVEAGVVWGHAIQEIVTEEARTPELIAPNGIVGVFSKSNGEGWACEAGDIITWTFEKYPADNGRLQSLAVGYIKDGVLHEAQAYPEMSATYEFDVTENGNYHIYFMCASSDPISLKEGEISVK